MIGWFNASLAHYFRERYGEAFVHEVLQRAGLDMAAGGPSDDQATYSVVEIAAGLLGKESELLWEEYGEYHLNGVRNVKDAPVLRALGSSFVSLLQNLDSLHMHLGTIYREGTFPTFRCDRVTPTSLELHYQSHRLGLWPIVKGMLRAIARDFFHLEVAITLLRTRKAGNRNEAVLLVEYPQEGAYPQQQQQQADGIALPLAPPPPCAAYAPSPVEFLCLFPFHIVLDLQCRVVQLGGAYARLLPGLKAGDRLEEHLEIVHPPCSFDFFSLCQAASTAFVMRARGASADAAALELKGQMVLSMRNEQGSLAPLPLTGEGSSGGVPPEAAGLNPLARSSTTSLVASSSCSTSQRTPQPARPEGACDGDGADVAPDRPISSISAPSPAAATPPPDAGAKRSIPNRLKLELPSSDNAASAFAAAWPFGASPSPGGCSSPSLQQQHACSVFRDLPLHLVFMASPRVLSWEQMEASNLKVSDIPLHDAAQDFVYAAHHSERLKKMMAEVEQQAAGLRKTYTSLAAAQAQLNAQVGQADKLLWRMLPPLIAEGLRAGQQVEALDFDEVTVLFSHITNFDEIVASITSQRVMGVVSELFNAFDGLLKDFPACYKVETVGDCYMVVCGITIPTHDHVDVMLDLGMQMLATAERISSGLGSSKLSLSLGLHCGPITAGVVGTKAPRFRCFGDTVNTASRMDSTGIAGRLHISRDAYMRIVDRSRFAIIPRSLMHIKGKGPMRTYFVAPHDDSVLQLRQAAAAASPSRDATGFLDTIDSSSNALPELAESECLFVPGNLMTSMGSQEGLEDLDSSDSPLHKAPTPRRQKPSVPQRPWDKASSSAGPTAASRGSHRPSLDILQVPKRSLPGVTPPVPELVSNAIAGGTGDLTGGLSLGSIDLTSVKSGSTSILSTSQSITSAYTRGSTSFDIQAEQLPWSRSDSGKVGEEARRNRLPRSRSAAQAPGGSPPTSGLLAQRLAISTSLPPLPPALSQDDSVGQLRGELLLDSVDSIRSVLNGDSNSSARGPL